MAYFPLTSTAQGMKIRAGLLAFVCVAFSCSPAIAVEIWRCQYKNAPQEFPASIEFWISGDQVVEDHHLPYKILQNNSFGIVAVSSQAGNVGGQPFGPAEHYVGEAENAPVVGKPVIWAETLEISRQTGVSILRVADLDGNPNSDIRGVCQLKPPK